MFTSSYASVKLFLFSIEIASHDRFVAVHQFWQNLVAVVIVYPDMKNMSSASSLQLFRYRIISERDKQ